MATAEAPSGPSAKRIAMLEKMAENVRTGGKGSMRRKKKAPHKTNAADDKKLQSSLKKLGVAPIGDIEEVNLFMNNSTVVHFSKPKVQASIPSNTYVVSPGASPAVTKDVKDILPHVLGQMGTQNLEQLKELQAQLAGGAAPAEAAKGEDEIPEDDENFDEAN
eukprot:NODE_1983_length_681_cov_112.532491_g1933_i0.p1 GENE.NODE_1983_length_681_cov_112.532491_g1933_i0~~NODE_1983_length_681_cov_112.532491_g1933_i0.p1  ORF type:complete len:163 (+),score=54.68 NODE_1983_length_681_cov_112.532491_g1933_i0:140-628(+)